MVSEVRGPITQLFLVSYGMDTGLLSRELLDIRKRENIRIPVEIKQKPTAPRATRKPGIQVIVVRHEATADDLELLMKVLQRHDNARLIIGAKNEKTTWLPPWAPSFRESFQTLQKTTREIETLRNNGGSSKEIRFFEKLQFLCENDLKLKTGIQTQATLALLDREFENFMRGFDVWLS